ncbi:MAG: aldo/keto reductase [Acidobacteria bacterium]|nr:aldo/keto reductase [Acidobacteriota bacterium]
MQCRLLGRSGLMVPPFGFGTGTFGGKGWFAALGNTGVEEARRLVDICIDHGVTLFDTADAYSEGVAEEVLGAAVKDRRTKVLITTKVGGRMGPGPNDVGLSRQHIMAACEASLHRLGTDYIDLYLAHMIDSLIPMEETCRAFDDLIRQGKVRYVGCSNFSAWQTMKAVLTSDRLGFSRYIAQQIHYSLLTRDPEWELIPMGVNQGVGVMAWSPLSNGLLSGKFHRGAPPLAESRQAVAETVFGIDWERLYRIVEVLKSLAVSRGATPAQVALNWVRSKPGVDTVIIGARNEQQLRDNLGAAGWELSAEEVARLDEVSATPQPYPYAFQQKFASERNPCLPSRRS